MPHLLWDRWVPWSVTPSRLFSSFHLLLLSTPPPPPPPPSGANHRSAQVLILLVIPGHVIFLYTIHLMKSGHTTLTPIFMSVYLATALLQVRRGSLNRSTDTNLHQACEIASYLFCAQTLTCAAQTGWSSHAALARVQIGTASFSIAQPERSRRFGGVSASCGEFSGFYEADGLQGD